LPIRLSLRLDLAASVSLWEGRRSLSPEFSGYRDHFLHVMVELYETYCRLDLQGTTAAADHRLTLVKIPEGNFIAEVGFGGQSPTVPHLSRKSPWTGVDSNTGANVFSIVVELPTSELAPNPEVHIWGRCSVRQDGKLVHVDRAGHPSVSSFFSKPTTRSWNTPASR
jgi:hypothetical protein